MVLSYAKVGLKVERWFAQNKLPETPDAAASIHFTRDVLDAARSLGWPLPEPEYVHQDDAGTIGRWLADCRAAGRPAQLDTNASSGVRICLAALDHGLDISGSFFRLGGEPYTEQRLRSFTGPAAGLPAIIHQQRLVASGRLVRRPNMSTRCIC